MAKPKQEQKRFYKTLLEQMLTLSTSAFGLVAALAWNSLIQEFVKQYLQPILGESSGIVSMLIYAVLVTVLAVAVTYQLTRLKDKV